MEGGARCEQQDPHRKHGIDGGHDLRGQVIDFEQAATPQQGALVGGSRRAISRSSGVSCKASAKAGSNKPKLLHAGGCDAAPLR